MKYLFHEERCKTGEKALISTLELLDDQLPGLVILEVIGPEHI